MIHQIHLHHELPKIWFIPDVHGNEKAFGWIYHQAHLNNVDLIFQLGDFGYNWPKKINEYHSNTIDHLLRYSPYNIPVYFIPGNHDNWDKIDKHLEKYDFKYPVQINRNLWVVPRGGIVRAGGLNFFCFSGAVSADSIYRTPDRTKWQTDHKKGPWWAREAPSEEEIAFAKTQLQNNKIDIILSHDTVSCITKNQYAYAKNIWSQLPVDHVQHILSNLERYCLDYKLWIYGHHHEIKINNIDGKTFICPGRFDYYGNIDSLVEFDRRINVYNHFNNEQITNLQSYQVSLLVKKKKFKSITSLW